MRKKSIRILIVAIITTISMGILTGCSNGNKKSNDNTVTIAVSGSTSVGPLMEKEAEMYKSTNGNVTVEIQQIGSSAGIKNVVSGVSEMGMASRKLKDEEKSQVKETAIAYDGVAVITHSNNKIEDLKIEQIKDIYTGKITNWKELGGIDAPIVVVSREDGSGTRDAFQESVGFKSENLIIEAIISDGNGNIKSTVANNENAIGYISFEHLDDTVNPLKINGVEPKAENVLNENYKLWRPFLVVYKEEEITEAGQNFIDYILSEEGQKVVEENGCIKVN